MKTIDELRQYAAFLRAELVFDQPRITVNMPLTKYQEKHGVGADFIALSEQSSWQDNIDDAFNFMKDWEEYWDLFHTIKQDEIKEFIKKKLRTDPRWITKALVLIFNHQTIAEQQTEMTTIRNNVGFTGHDGHILCSFAKWFLTGKPITEKMMNVLKKSMPKYWKQVWENSDKKKMLKLIRAANPVKQMKLRLDGTATVRCDSEE